MLGAFDRTSSLPWKNICFAICVLGLTAVVLWLAVKYASDPGRGGPTPDKAGYPLSRHIEYGFTLQNTTAWPMERAELWTTAPVPRNATQHCGSLTASHPYELLTDSLGNQVLHFVLPDIPPHGTKIIRIAADLDLSQSPQPVSSDNPRAFLTKEKYVESDDPDLLNLAVGLKASTPSKTAESIYQWVARNIRYTGYSRTDRGALYALRHREGDCTEYMYLVTALCRANGIPARGVAGYVCPTDSVLNPSGFHNWAEVYLDGAWRIMDAQRKFFMQESPPYIAMRILGDEPAGSVRPMGEYHRFRFLGEGLKVEMSR